MENLLKKFLKITGNPVIFSDVFIKNY